MKVLRGFRAKLCVELCVEPPYAELRAASCGALYSCQAFLINALSTITKYPPKSGKKDNVVFFTRFLLVLLSTRNYYRGCRHPNNLA